MPFPILLPSPKIQQPFEITYPKVDNNKISVLSSGMAMQSIAALAERRRIQAESMDFSFPGRTPLEVEQILGQIGIRLTAEDIQEPRRDVIKVLFELVIAYFIPARLDAFGS